MTKEERKKRRNTLSAKWARENKEKVRKTQAENYQKNKEKIKAKRREKMTPEKKQYHKEYYLKNKEKYLEYYRVYYRLKKMGGNHSKNLTLRKIEVTKEEIAIARKAAYIYAMKSPFFITPYEVLGDSYICLLMAIQEYKADKYPNRNSFLSHTIAKRLIDIYRSEFGRGKSYKREMLTNMASLNATITNSYGEDTERIVLLEAKNVSPELKMDAKFFREKVKTEMGKITFSKKVKCTSLYKMWYSYFIIGETMDMIADKYDMSSSRVSQIFTLKIKPCFDKLRDEMREQYPEYLQ